MTVGDHGTQYQEVVLERVERFGFQMSINATLLFVGQCQLVCELVGAATQLDELKMARCPWFESIATVEVSSTLLSKQDVPLFALSPEPFKSARTWRLS